MYTLSNSFETRLSRFHAYEKHIPVVARFFLVATFFEDGIRMFLDWNLQMDFLGPKLTYTGAAIFLVMSALMQIIGGLVVVTSHPALEYAVYTLLVNIVLQACIYGIFSDAVLLLRNCALMGGLLMLLSEKRLNEGRKTLLLSTPINSLSTSTRYIQLAGRTLLVLLVVAHMPLQFSNITVIDVFLVLLCGVLLVMVVSGFKTRLSALFLVVSVCVANLLWNNFWMLDYHHPERDFFQYYFFQTVSIVGGLMLLVTVGPGDLSVDERKKKF